MTFQSEIRISSANELLEKVSNRDYGKYLPKNGVSKPRTFTGGSIIFDFSVTALVGPNGEGKTTISGAGACAYRTLKPRLYFCKSGNLTRT